MYLIVGLGNPDSKYAGNRHNVGFQIIDALANAFGANAFGVAPWRSKFSGACAEIFVETKTGRTKVLLLKPATYYNESGRSVRAALDFHKIEIDKVCVIHDELALEPGKFRTKFGGGSAGNNGIKSISAHLGPNFWRVRIGIGHPGSKDKVTPYVLHDFPKNDQAWVRDLTEAIVGALPLFLDSEMDAFQTKVTHLAPAPNPKGNK